MALQNEDRAPFEDFSISVALARPRRFGADCERRRQNRAARPLVLIYATIAFGVTLIFRADVDAQGGAYATGVLVLMTSAAVAVTLSAWRTAHLVARSYFAMVTLVFAYTTSVNVIERPDGIKIGIFFIAAIILSSLGFARLAHNGTARREDRPRQRGGAFR
jgi:hypothetical protein